MVLVLGLKFKISHLVIVKILPICVWYRLVPIPGNKLFVQGQINKSQGLGPPA